MFYSFYHRQNRNIFFVFRIHTFIAAVIHTLILVYILVMSGSGGVFLFLNTLLFTIGILTTILFDPFISSRSRFTSWYILSILLLLATGRVVQLSTSDNGLLFFLFITTVLGGLTYFLLPWCVGRFLSHGDEVGRFTHTVKLTGSLELGITNIALVYNIFAHPGALTLSILLLAPLTVYHIWVHRSFRNYIALSLVCFSLLGLYYFFLTQTFELLGRVPFLISVIFPAAVLVIGTSLYIFPRVTRTDVYIVHYFALLAMVVFTLYGLSQVTFARGDVYSYSLLFIESLIWYGSYLQMRKFFFLPSMYEKKDL